MTAVAIGEGVTLSEITEAEVFQFPVHTDTPAGDDLDNIVARVRVELRQEMDMYVADAERRLAQARELENSAFHGTRRSVHTEDLNVGRHMVDGYTLTANSPGAGSIAWSSLHIVLLGVDYTIADGNTANKYVWFVKPGSGTTATLQTSNTMPTLGSGDALIFVNNAGVPVSILESSVSYAVGPNVIGSGQIADGAVTATKTDFYSSLVSATSAALTAAQLAQATADGSIATYFQSDAPWANGTSPGVGKIGDVWYDSDDGQAYRWSGEGGSWVPISDSDMGAALTAANNAQTTANSKITTFYAAAAAVPTALAVGDLWVVTDQGNLIKRASAVGTGSWVSVQLGDAAISGIGGGKVGAGINAANVDNGTLAAARVGAGVNGAVLTTATGTVGNSQIGANAVTPAKINAAFHLLY